MANGDTKTESYLRVAAEGTRADLPSDTCCNTKTQNLILGVANRIMDVEDEVEELKNNPDVADIVSTYADLQNYDTSTLTDKDIIRVLQDETHDGDSTYYRYSTSTGEFTYVGESKQYTNFVGTDGTSAGESGLVPAPTAADADKFLKSDGTWDTVGGGSTVNVVQTAGTSTTDVMSQNATTSMIFNDPSDRAQIVIGAAASVSQPAYLVVLGRSAKGRGESVSIGYGAGSTDAQRNYNVNLGSQAVCGSNYSVALGYYAKTTRNGELNVGTGNYNYGYDSTPYRVIGGVHDGVDAHDAATVGQLSYRQKKPVTVWEVDGEVVTTGLVAVGEDISANPNWQLTNLDLTPFARIKIYSKAAQKAGTTASASTTPAIILEMSLDPRAAIAEYGGNYVGSMLAQKPNDANRLCTLTCAVSADKTKFEVLRMTNLYGTAATSNSDVNAYVFKIEGYYE